MLSMFPYQKNILKVGVISVGIQKSPSRFMANPIAA